MTIGSQGLKAVAGLGLAAIIFAGLASCSAALLPDGVREVPDLTVVAPAIGAGAPAAGTTFTLSVAVSNQGEGKSAAATLRYYRSTDATITSSDTEVGMATVAQLAAAESSSRSVQLTAPSSPGTYYYGACVDPVRDESDTTNNCSTSVQVTVPEPETGPEPGPEPEPERHPDLVVSSPSVSDSGPAGGAQFTLSATVSNGGEGAAAATMLRYYRSTDVTITTTDTEVGTDATGELAAAGSSSQSVELTAPATPATYYYGACVDPVTDESDTTNNCSDSVEVTVPEPERPDLVVTAPAASDVGPAAGAQFTLSATVRNDGEGTAAATTLRYYRSADATITTSDTSLGTVAIAGLAGSGSSSQSVDLTAPASPGTYYYGACVDVVTDESDTTNNCSASVQVTVQVAVPEPQGHSDLMVTSPSVNDSGPAAGAQFTLSATVQNDGEGTAAATTLRYYRSADATITTSDSAVGTVAIARLAGSGSSSQSVDLTAPASPGTYYYGACVDAVPDESDTANNCSDSVPLTVAQNSVEVTPREVTLAALGDTAALTARVLDAQGNEIPGEAVSWSSSFPEVATVDAAGVVTAVVNGRATVTASASGATGRATVIVDQRVVSVDIDPGEVELTSVGDTAALTLRAFDANGHEVPYAGDIMSFAWRSADLDVAIVSSLFGLTAQAHAAGAGTTTVTVTAVTEDGGRLSGTATVTVTVTEEGKPDLEILSIETLVDGVGNTYPLESFQVEASVLNDGDGPSEATTLRIYRSADTTVDASDTEVGTAPVAGLAASEDADTARYV